MSEIDDIFGGSGPTKGHDTPIASTSSQPKSHKNSKKNKSDAPQPPPTQQPTKDDSDSKKRKRPDSTAEADKSATLSESNDSKKLKKPKSKKQVEEVSDPSAGIGTATQTEPDQRAMATASRLVAAHDAARGSNGKVKGRPYVAPPQTDDSDAAFADSRGLRGGGRKTTTEGWSVYSEAELGMDNPYAGETDLCPFDCDCCKLFSGIIIWIQTQYVVIGTDLCMC